MSEFNIYPSLDGNLQFPPSVKNALLASPEFVARFGNVNNTSDAQKPVSTAMQTALNLKANLASPTFTGTVKGITAAMVGLGNVNNTSDANKPVSTAQAAAFVPRWKPATAYAVGDQVIGPTPEDMVLTCTSAHTSSTDFSADIVSRWNSSIFSGTTTERNAMFLTSTVAQQVALANKQVRFYNTTDGWWESYYSPAATGLIVTPLIAGNAAGWYPDGGSDLRAHRGLQSGFVPIAADTNLEPVFGDLLLNTKGRFTKVGNTGIGLPFGGFYRVFGNGYYSGTTSGNITAHICTTVGGTIIRGSSDKPNSLDHEANVNGIYPFTKSNTIRMYFWSSSATALWGTTGYNGARLSVEYAGPPISN